MTYIRGKGRDDIIKSLKKVGEIVVLAKAEIIYAFMPGFWPLLTTEQIMEEIKKQPEAYEYYRAGLIKITDIEEVGEKLSSGWEVATPDKTNSSRNVPAQNSKPINCDDCDLWGECDHKGAYQKDGKWCYDDEKEVVSVAPLGEEGIKSTVQSASSKPPSKLEEKWFSCENYFPMEDRCITFQCDKCNFYKEKEAIIGSGSINDQFEFNREKKWEKKKD